MGVPMMPDDTVILSNPKNFVQVNTYTMKIRKDETSVESIRKDKKFYVIHFDFDEILEEINDHKPSGASYGSFITEVAL